MYRYSENSFYSHMLKVRSVGTSTKPEKKRKSKLEHCLNPYKVFADKHQEKLKTCMKKVTAIDMNVNRLEYNI